MLLAADSPARVRRAFSKRTLVRDQLHLRISLAVLRGFANAELDGPLARGRVLRAVKGSEGEICQRRVQVYSDRLADLWHGWKREGWHAWNHEVKTRGEPSLLEQTGVRCGEVHALWWPQLDGV